VLRKPHQHDRRSWLVVLTEKGRAAFAQHDRFHKEFTDEISAGLSNSEISQLAQLLTKLLERM